MAVDKRMVGEIGSFKIRKPWIDVKIGDRRPKKERKVAVYFFNK
jgi:hypothetical protein